MAPSKISRLCERYGGVLQKVGNSLCGEDESSFRRVESPATVPSEGSIFWTAGLAKGGDMCKILHLELSSGISTLV